MPALSVSRARDRAIMAQRVADLAQSLGATAEIEPMGDRELWVKIRAARGLCLTVDFDGDSRQQREGVWVLSWHIATDSDACLDDSFGGSVNPHHFSKATYIGRGFDGLFGLLGQVELGLCKARDGDAFNAEREAAQVAKNGSAADRAAYWAKCREEFAAECAAKRAAA